MSSDEFDERFLKIINGALTPREQGTFDKIFFDKVFLGNKSRNKKNASQKDLNILKKNLGYTLIDMPPVTSDYSESDFCNTALKYGKLATYAEISKLTNNLEDNQGMMFYPIKKDDWYAQCVRRNGFIAVELAYNELDNCTFNYLIRCLDGTALDVNDAVFVMEYFVRNQKLPEGYFTDLVLY